MYKDMVWINAFSQTVLSMFQLFFTCPLLPRIASAENTHSFMHFFTILCNLHRIIKVGEGL